MTGRRRSRLGWPAGRHSRRQPAIARASRPEAGGWGGGPDSEDGSLSLELALTVPALFLLMLVVFHAAVYARDALLVQDAARRGARVAATTLDDGAITAAVRDALDGRPAAVAVQPSARRAGHLVRVTVTLQSRAIPRAAPLTATAVAAVEPGVGA